MKCNGKDKEWCKSLETVTKDSEQEINVAWIKVKILEILTWNIVILKAIVYGITSAFMDIWPWLLNRHTSIIIINLLKIEMNDTWIQAESSGLLATFAP